MNQITTQKKRALITGISGFTGPYMQRELENADIKVYGLTDHKTQPNDFECNLLDLPKLTKILAEIKPDYVIHLAGISHVQHHDQVEIYRVNVFGTLNLLQAIHDAKVQPTKVLIASSAQVYGLSKQSPLDEITPPCPTNHYGNSKLAMEFMVKTWFDKLPIIIVRPFNYTGVGQTTNFVIPKIVEHFKQKKIEITLGNIAVVRDFSDVRMITNAYHTLLTSNAVSDTFNICSGQGYSLAQAIKYLEQLAGYSIKVHVDPSLLRKNEIQELIGDNKKLLRIIEVANLFSLEETLRWMFNAN